MSAKPDCPGIDAPQALRTDEDAHIFQTTGRERLGSIGINKGISRRSHDTTVRIPSLQRDCTPASGGGPTTIEGIPKVDARSVILAKLRRDRGVEIPAGISPHPTAIISAQGSSEAKRYTTSSFRCAASCEVVSPGNSQGHDGWRRSGSSERGQHSAQPT